MLDSHRLLNQPFLFCQTVAAFLNQHIKTRNEKREMIFWQLVQYLLKKRKTAPVVKLKQPKRCVLQL